MSTYTEDHLIEQPAIQLLEHELGWDSVNAYDEWSGGVSSLGRESMRQLGICEERGHGIDEVVSHIEVFQLPPYRCRLGSRHTTVVLCRYKTLKELAPEERVHAVYHHCCLRFVNNEITNNESVRARFGIEKKNSAQASRLLNEALDAGRIKLVNPDAANKLRRYMSYWA